MQSDDDATAVVSTIPQRRPPRTAGRTTLAATVVVVLLAGVSVLVWPLLFRPAASSTGGEVYRESTTTPGRDPFSDTLVLGNPPGAKSQTPAGASGGGAVNTIAGDVPALYGGSRNEHVCDRQKLATFLQQNPDKAAAWATVLGVATADIPTYVATLTPMQLRADTRVTNHGFADGHATSLQSVLQAGTAVLVDDHGRPRVKCGCGNPLLDPVATPITPVYTGDTWPDFSPTNISAVTPAKIQVDRFVVYDLRNGETFYRPRGTDGDQDQPTTPPATTTMPVPSPTVVACPSGAHLSGTTCVANAPPRCPAGQVRNGGRCVPTAISCPDGSHPADDGTSCDPDPPNCPDGTHRDGDTCVPDRSQGDCPPGTHPKSTLCVSDEIPHCDDGYHVSYTNKCIQDCPDGYRQDARDNCVADRPTTPPPCPDGAPRTPAGVCYTGTRRPPVGRRRRSPSAPAR